MIADYLEQNDQAYGVEFDCWWVPEKIERIDSELNLKFIGSPSGEEEEDIVTWLKLAGAVDISGELIFDGGGDVEVIPI